MTGSTWPATPAKPIENMRVTLWGVQGSCPIFPTPYGVQEYSRRLAVHVLGRVVEDMQRKGKDGRCSAEELLGGPLNRETIEAYQQTLGLPDLPIYGGETTSIQIETSEGNMILLDAGSGIRRCSLDIVHRWEDRVDRRLHIFGSHEHLDHRSGLTFSRFLYVEPNPFTVYIYGSYQFLRALDQHYGLFSHKVGEVTYLDDPVDYTFMPARFDATEFRRPGDAAERKGRSWRVQEYGPIEIGSTTVTPFEVYHVIPCCLGYTIRHNGRTFVFATDHEKRRGPRADDERQVRSDAAEAELCRQLNGADLAYVDGQYFLDEYDGRKGIGTFPPISRLDWGHSCIEDVIERSANCGVKRTLIGHHDPERAWTERVEIDKELQRMCAGRPFQVQLAESDAVFDL